MFIDDPSRISLGQVKKKVYYQLPERPKNFYHIFSDPFSNPFYKPGVENVEYIIQITFEKS